MSLGFPQIGLRTLILLAVSVIAFTCTSCSHKAEDPHADAKAPESSVRIVKVSDDLTKKFGLQTDVVKTREVTIPLMLTGRIEPDLQKEVDVGTRVAGRITKIFVDPGTNVKKGQIIALIDSREITEIQTDLIEAEASLRIAEIAEERERHVYEEQLQRPTTLIEARAVFNEQKVVLELSESEFQRMQGLVKDKIVATKDFLASKAGLATAKVNYEKAKATLEREEKLYKNRAMLKRDYHIAQAEADRARNAVLSFRQRLVFLGCDKPMIERVVKTKQIDGTIEVSSPIHGVVNYHDIAVGELVRPEIALFSVSDTSTVLLQVDLPEADLRAVKRGQQVQIKVFTGTINYIGVKVNQTTRTVPIKARLDNKDGILRNNMFADIQLEGEEQTVLSCPKDSLQEHGDEKVVFVKHKDGFEERRVRVGFQGEKYVQVLSGLQDGDVVATQGSLMLKTEISYQN
jgi:RND family efflux transporter MFP subunit